MVRAPWSGPRVRGHIIKASGFETAVAFADWTGTAGGGASSVVTTVVHSGLKAASFAIIAPGYAQAYYTLPATSTVLYMRSYLRFTIVPANNAEIVEVYPEFVEASFTVPLAYLYVTKDAGTIKWALGYETDAASLDIISTSGLLPTINTWYPAVIYMKQGTGTGETAAWINGIPIAYVGGLTNDDHAIARVNVGNYSPTTFGTVYHDCVVVSDQYIGPEVPNFNLLKGRGGDKRQHALRTEPLHVRHV